MRCPARDMLLAWLKFNSGTWLHIPPARLEAIPFPSDCRSCYVWLTLFRFFLGGKD